MNIRQLYLLFGLLGIYLIGCNQTPSEVPTQAPEQTAPVVLAPTDTPSPTQSTSIDDAAIEPESTDALAEIPTGVFISEILLGIEGGNNTEFIELYFGAGDEIVDLRGWSLNYKSRPDTEEKLLYRWSRATLVPPQGHYLLVREGEDVGVAADALFTTPLSGTKGGIILRNLAGDVIDTVGWGEAPPDYFVGAPVAKPEAGQSIERLPGGEAGNFVRNGDNSADTQLNPQPNPQNSGDDPTPLPNNRLSITLSAPESVAPGAEFTYEIEVSNPSLAAASNINVVVPLDEAWEVASLPDGAEVVKGKATLVIPSIAAGETLVESIGLVAPITYFDSPVVGYYAQADGWLASFGAAQMVSVGGAALPIATARDLAGSVVSVEGIATMFTGGFFAGGSGTKFYVQDESAGIQVYIPDGLGNVNVDVGDRVKVTGLIEPYRDSIEIIPEDYAVQIEILESNAAEIDPVQVSIAATQTDDSLFGRFASVEGTAVAIEELTYDWQIQLQDEEANVVTVLIEKQSGVSAETLDVGTQYRIAGISEYYSQLKQIKPRFQSDISEIFPPEIRLTTDLPTNLAFDIKNTTNITVTNYAPEPMTNVVISTTGDYGAVYEIGDLAAFESQTVSVEMDTANEDAWIWIGGTTATSDQQSAENAATLPERYVFIGDSVPIWAIQGMGDRSPYVRNELTTRGIVTGVFPELDGFWIQEEGGGDLDPNSSDGLFVLTEGFRPMLESGDLIYVTGLVREMSGQTTLDTTQEGIEILLRGNELPEPIVIDPPIRNEDADPYKESLEGMLVMIDAPAVAVGPTSRYGETPLVYSRWSVTAVQRLEQSGFVIVIDDGSSVRHEDQTTQPIALAKGDEVLTVTGPLAYTFDQYKIEPITKPTVGLSDQELPSIDIPDGHIGIATFNMENFFDRFDPNPSDPPKPSKAEYETKLLKLAEAIKAMDYPAIIGVQEVENLGVLKDLSEQNPIYTYEYQVFLFDNPAEGRGIDVGYLVRPDLARVVNSETFPAPDGLTSRPPHALTVEIAGRTVYVLNNHFSSLASGEAATEPRRTAQAAWNVELINNFRSNNPDADIVLLGDLNSFYQTPPIDIIQQEGELRHVYETVPQDGHLPYTYIFQGKTQTLDHILVSQGLFEQLTSVEALHINADFPLLDPTDQSARSVSDHDPLIAIFDLR